MTWALPRWIAESIFWPLMIHNTFLISYLWRVMNMIYLLLPCISLINKEQNLKMTTKIILRLNSRIQCKGKKEQKKTKKTCRIHLEYLKYNSKTALNEYQKVDSLWNLDSLDQESRQFQMSVGIAAKLLRPRPKPKPFSWWLCQKCSDLQAHLLQIEAINLLTPD